MAIRGRRHRRFVVEDCTVEYRKHSALSFLGGAPKVAPLVDVSVGGLQFVSEDLYDIGQRMDLKVIIPSIFRSLTVQAEVVWSKRVTHRSSYRVGARLIHPPAEVISLLRTLEERFWALPDERKRPVSQTPEEPRALVGAGAPAQPRPPHDPTHPGLPGRVPPARIEPGSTAPPARVPAPPVQPTPPAPPCTSNLCPLRTLARSTRPSKAVMKTSGKAAA